MSVAEEEVGITEYTTDGLGFSGILKHRFRDFQVNEVDLEGNVAHLTTLAPPSAAPEVARTPLSGQQLAEAAADIAAAFSRLAGAENAGLLLQLIQAIAAATEPKQDSTAAAVTAATGTQGAAATDGNTATLASEPASESAAEPASTVAALTESSPVSVAAAETDVQGSASPAPDATPARAVAEALGAVEKLAGGGLQVLLEPSDSKDTRRAVHEFFKTHAQLPRMDTRMQEHAQGARKICVAWQPQPTPAAEQGAEASATGGARGGGRGGAGGRGGGRGGKRSRDDPDGGRRPGWEGGSHQFVRFLLYKENMESQMAVGLLSSYLRVNLNAFGYAGTKDKRGVTTQFMTAHRVEPWKLAALNDRLRGVRVGGPWSYCAKQLQLGLLSGNEFRLLMRAVSPTMPKADAAAAGSEDAVAAAGEMPLQAQSSDSTQLQHRGEDVTAAAGERQVEEACRRVAEVGFINYFGLQRFGTGGAPTHQIGVALLRGELQRAIHLIMVGRPGEKPDVAAARAPYLERGDAKASLRLMPRWATAERAILEVLSRHQQASKAAAAKQSAGDAAGTDGAAADGATCAAAAALAAGPSYSPAALAAAMRSIPRTLRMMYLHAYQSYLWNLAASHRVREHGVQRVVAGDLVLPPAAAEPSAAALDGGAEADGIAAAANVGCGDGSEAAAGAEAAGGAGAAGSARHRLAAVHVVTEEEARAGRWSVQDVVLPLPGSMVRYPQHSTALVYVQTARKDGVKLAGEGLPADTDGDLEPVAAGASGSEPQGHGKGSEQGAPDCKEWRSLVAECSLGGMTGDYRHVMLKPKCFEWRLQRYSDPNDDSLVETDLEKLTKSTHTAPEAGTEQRQAKRARPDSAGISAAAQGPQPGSEAGSSGQGGTAMEADEPGSVQQGGDEQQASQGQQALGSSRSQGLQGASDPAQASATEQGALDTGSGVVPKPLLALNLRFQLPSSCYATMLIRELTKQSTHKDFQAGLSGALQ